jgi:2-polyprenyl-6-methoxyphenol hydroxylase-like FAD-dependent oxidoreductase
VPKIIVLGGGVSGLAAGLLLCRDGHDVTVLERDAAPVPASPEAAWERWGRDGVAQFRQTHYLTPRGRAVLDTELPDVRGGLETAGAPRLNILDMMPPSVGDRAARDGDGRFVTLSVRRSTVEHVLASVAEAEPGLDVRRGALVRGLAVGDGDGVPHVAGIRLETGEELAADLVVDAMGRGSRLPRWLAAAGIAPMHEEAEDSGFLYYSRYFRSPTGAGPEFRAPLLTEIGTFSVLTVPADNGVWSVTLYASAGDQALKQLRDPAVWTALLSACPLHAQWLDGEPITGVEAMGGIVDRYRRLVGDDGPVVTGLALLGDAWACTNPSLGRGMTLGLIHAGRLRDVVRSDLGDPLEFAAAWDAVTERELTPGYRETVEEDRGRLGQMTALRAGREPDPPGESAARRLTLLSVAGTDADAFRAYMANRSCLRLQRELWQDAGVASCIGGPRDRPGRARPPFPGPDREQLLGLMTAAGAPA